MFSSSVRRAALTAPQAPIVSSLTSSSQRTVASQALPYRSHQRRFSSSKPSSPADGSKGVARGQEVPSKPSSPANGSKGVAQDQDVLADAAQARADSEKKSSRTNKRKAKAGALWNLPSVPSTQHIPPGREFTTSVLRPQSNIVQKLPPPHSSLFTDRYLSTLASLKMSPTMHSQPYSHLEQEQKRSLQK
jgi:hypothetical protein